MSREQHIARTFVELADTLVEDFDVIDFLQQMTVRCQELLDITDAAVLLAHSGTRLYSPAPCDPAPGLQRVLEVALDEGPALEAYRTARSIVPENAADAAARWPRFTEQVLQSGYALPSVVPMRLRKDSIGCLILLHTGERSLTVDDLSLAQTLADAATIGLLHARTLRQQETVNTQLHTALHSRILIEQAKGILAARRNIPLNQAFEAIRYYARHHRTLLSKVAQEVIDGGLVPPDPPAGPRGQSVRRKAAGE
ncbi:GAF and ANTAR domain-containing protein [Streptomyces sp. NPDC051214]|uniref:GAF and ANTAR domain-containing protein n=1 Tax=Streptomyces sp. NPDC051214 TaxID=3155282 RepID=UPI003413707A